MIMPLLAVDNIQASMDFYTQKLGFTNGGTMDFADGRLMMGFLNLGSNSLMLGIDEDVTTPKGKGVDIYLGLDDDTDIDTYYDQVKSNGTALATELKTEFWGDRTFNIKDPDGYSIVFFKTVKQVSMDEAQAIINTQAT